jgi:hypothetical protein
MLPGALTGRLSCGHSETSQTNRRNGNLDGGALNGRSKTALNSAVVRSCHSRPAPFRCRFQNARSVLGHHQPESTVAMLLQMQREMHTFVLSRLQTIMRTTMPSLPPTFVLGQMLQLVPFVCNQSCEPCCQPCCQLSCLVRCFDRCFPPANLHANHHAAFNCAGSCQLKCPHNFVRVLEWTPHPLDFQGSVVREGVAD